MIEHELGNWKDFIEGMLRKWFSAIKAWRFHRQNNNAVEATT